MNSHVARIATVVVAALVMFARTEANAQTPPQPLAGTSWQLVRIQSMDDKVVTPSDRSKYTMTFGADGRVSMRVACNRGSGTWKSAEASQLVFGPMAMTRVMYPPGSLPDRIVKDMPYVRSYVIRDEHLFLSLIADGGIYELEPMPKASAAAPPASTGPVTYACTGPDGANDKVIATFHQTDPPSVLVERGDRAVLGTQVRAASGAKYEGANLMFWEHQGEAAVTWMKLELKCKPRK
jgi:heat shock protein HslJ/membrane-bound inhibitor of C-type lysozyme